MWETLFSQNIAVCLPYYTCTIPLIWFRNCFENFVEVNLVRSLISVLNVWTCRPTGNVSFNLFWSLCLRHVIQASYSVDKISISRNKHHSWKFRMLHFVFDRVNCDSDIDFFLDSWLDGLTALIFKVMLVRAFAILVIAVVVFLLKPSNVDVIFSKFISDCVVPFL